MNQLTKYKNINNNENVDFIFFSANGFQSTIATSITNLPDIIINDFRSFKRLFDYDALPSSGLTAPYKELWYKYYYKHDL